MKYTEYALFIIGFLLVVLPSKIIHLIGFALMGFAIGVYFNKHILKKKK